MDLKTKDIAEKLADYFLQHNFVNKAHLVDKITPIINIWVKRQNKTKIYKQSTKQSKLQYTIEKRGIESKFWLNILRDKLSDAEMKELYAKQKTHFIKESVYTYEDWIKNHS